ncbi:MAG: hypothetical protein ACYCYK_08745 [Candidatus Dormibacteria bacterium]
MNFSYPAYQEVSLARQLELIDSLVAAGKEEFTFEDASATANTLRRLQDNGPVDRLGRGRYAIRSFGSLHTSAITDDLALAVGATFAARLHRIAYLSAFADLGLLSHPVRTITVACTHQVRAPAISKPIGLGTRGAPHWSGPCSNAPSGSTSAGASSGSLKPSPRAQATPTRLAFRSSPRPSVPGDSPQSVASPLLLRCWSCLSTSRRLSRLDPRDEHVVWVDDIFRVAWNLSADELQAVARN